MTLDQRYERTVVEMTTAYSLGPIDQCSDIGSPGAYCGINYKVPYITARYAGQLAKDEKLIINGFTNNPKYPVSAKCASDIKNFYCNAFYPKCDPAKKTITYSLQGCDILGKSCPKAIYDSLRKAGSCDLFPSGTYKTNQCVKAIASGTKLCPKPNANAKVPAWLSHEDQLNDNGAQNLKAFMIQGNTTSACIANMINFLCTIQPFCSIDGKTLLTTGTKNQCNAALNW